MNTYSSPCAVLKRLQLLAILVAAIVSSIVLSVAQAAIIVDPDSLGDTDITDLSGNAIDVSAGVLPGVGVAMGYSGDGSLQVDSNSVPSLLTTSTAIIGFNSGSVGSIDVDGGAWTTGNAAIIVGRDGRGEMSIENGGVVESGIGSIGQGSGSIGRVNVRGLNSEWAMSNLSVGSLGQGELVVSDTAAVIANGSTNVRSTGFLEVKTGASFNANGSIWISGGTFNTDVGTNFNVADDQLFTASDGAQVNFGSSYSLAPGMNLRVQSGADLSTGTYLDIGNGSTGKLLVEGVGSTLTTSELSFWGSRGGVAEITFRDQADADLGQVLLSNGSNVNSQADWQIESGAKATAETIAIGAGFGSASLDLSGAGSKLEANAITVGHDLSGAGQLVVSDQALLKTSNEVTEINATGILRVESGGIYEESSGLNVNGGRFVQESDGQFKLAENKGFIVSNGGVAEFARNTIQGNQSYIVQSGSEMIVDSYLEIGSLGPVGSGGSLLINQPGTKLAVNGRSSWGKQDGPAQVNFANQAQGELNVIDFGGSGSEVSSSWNIYASAQVTSDTISIAPTDGATAELTVSQAGSSLSQSITSSLNIDADYDSTASLSIRDGGELTTGLGTTLVKHGGTLNIANGGTLHANGDVRVDDGRLTVDHATFDLASGKTLHIRDESTVEFFGSHVIKNDTTFIVRGGSNFSIVGGLSAATNGTDGTLLLGGAGSTLTVSDGISIFGADGGHALFNATDDSEAEFAAVQLSHGNDPGTRSTWNILGGAQVTTGHFYAGTEQGTSDIRISGAGSSLTQTGDSRLALGRINDTFNFTNATLLLEAGGTLNTGTGTTTIGTGGLLQIVSGHLNATTIDNTHDGDLNFVGGSLSVTEFQGKLIQNGGIFYVGEENGLTTITDDYKAQNGALYFDIGGAPNTSDFDQLEVLGDTEFGLGVNLFLHLVDGFIPDPSDEFLILETESLFGGFENVANGDRIETQDGSGSFIVNYGQASPFDENQIVLSNFVANALSGDFDSDGDIDGSDFLAWQRGISPNPKSASDLAIWESNYGGGLAPLAQVSGASAIPEPATIGLIMLATILEICKRRTCQ